MEVKGKNAISWSHDLHVTWNMSVDGSQTKKPIGSFVWQLWRR